MPYNTYIRPARRLIVSIIMLSQLLSAQRDTSSTIPFSDIWAMEFGIGSSFTLTSFLDADIAGARYMADGSKLRLGVRLRGTSSKDDYNESIFYADTLSSSSEGIRESSWQSIALTIGYFGYTRQVQGVSLFMGGGPIVSYYSRHDKDDSKYDYPSSYGQRRTYDDSERSWSIGGTFAAGVEWFFADQMSLHAEYDVDLVYSKSTTSRTSHYFPIYYGYDSREERESNASGWKVGSQLVRFGITICY